MEKYTKSIIIQEKWQKKIQSVLLKTLGVAKLPTELEDAPNLFDYEAKVYYASSKMDTQFIKKDFEQFLKNCYDPQIKVSRVFLKMLIKFMKRKVHQHIGTSKIEYVQQVCSNVISKYSHVYLTKFNLVIFDYKPY